MTSLLHPKGIAVVGASQRPGRGSIVISNMRAAGFKGEIFAVNPRYEEVLGYPCIPSVSDLPSSVDCVVAAVGAAATCDILEEAYARGIRAAVVLAAGFGEGGSDETRGVRLGALASRGMSICGPNCLGIINAGAGVAAYGGALPRPLAAGPVALVSQSGGLAIDVFRPLMVDRAIGFSYIVSCGNQVGLTIEDYVDYFLQDDAVSVVAIVAEALKSPQKLLALGSRARAERRSIILFQPGRTTAGQAVTRSHTGALAGNGAVLAAFLRRCGIVQVPSHEALVETIALFAVAPRDPAIGASAVVISGSGGAAAVAADILAEHDVPVAVLTASTSERIQAAMPEFGSVSNPIDATGAIYDDPTLLPKVFDAILGDPDRPVIAASLSARAGANAGMRRLAETVAAAARASDRTIVAYQYSALGGPLDTEILQTLRSAGVPLLLGSTAALSALKYLFRRRAFWQRAAVLEDRPERSSAATRWDFMSARAALVDAGIPVVEAGVVNSATGAVTLAQAWARPVAVKAEVPNLLHKSDLGCVRLGCSGVDDVTHAYQAVIENARRAGFTDAEEVLVQPMVSGIAEAYAGIIDDPAFGSVICFGLGGIYVEVFKDVTSEMAPLTHEDALRMIHGIAAASILTGTRGGARGDVEALADLLVRLGSFAIANAGRFRSLDLNPIVVLPEGRGVLAVDIAVDAVRDERE